MCVCDLHPLYTTGKILLKDTSSFLKHIGIHMLKLKTIPLLKKKRNYRKKPYYNTTKVEMFM